jgi:hypothetical protein
MREMFNRLMGITPPPIETPVRAEPAPVEVLIDAPIEKPADEPIQPIQE